jgi:hypothetical protein
MAQTNKKTKPCESDSCIGCRPPKKFAFKLEGTIELKPFWNEDSVEQILGEAIDEGLNKLAQGHLQKRISYSLSVFKDE